MPFINVKIKDAKEGELLPEGNYPLRIAKAAEKESKKGNPMIECFIVAEGKEYAGALPIRHYINLPHSGMDEARLAMCTLDIARFLQLFQIPNDGDGFDTDDLQGATCEEGFVTQEPGDNNQTYNRLVLPRLQEAEEEARPSSRRAAGGRRR